MLIDLFTAFALALTLQVCVPASFVPELADWTGPSYSPVQGEPQALAALADLFVLLEGEGYPALVTSGYRSYEQQAWLHRQDRTIGGLPTTAPPGCSQHQLGTAFDLTIRGHSITSDHPDAVAFFTRLIEVAPQFGFSHPYLEAGDYAAEPWHINYGP